MIPKKSQLILRALVKNIRNNNGGSYVFCSLLTLLLSFGRRIKIELCHVFRVKTLRHNRGRGVALFCPDKRIIVIPNNCPSNAAAIAVLQKKCDFEKITCSVIAEVGLRQYYCAKAVAFVATRYRYVLQ